MRLATGWLIFIYCYGLFLGVGRGGGGFLCLYNIKNDPGKPPSTTFSHWQWLSLGLCLFFVTCTIFVDAFLCNPLNPMVTSYCALHRKDSLCTSRKGGTGGGGWGHPQGDMHMVGTRWANSHPCCMYRLRKRYSHLVRVHFWKGRLLGL